MHIELKGIGKRFNRQWIFRNLDYTFSSGNAYAITGYNGSGKSTLLQIIAGSMEKSEGSISWSENSGQVNPETFFNHLSFAAPYLELIEELTLDEFFEFHFSLKPLMNGWAINDIIERIGLGIARKKQIRHFSSGMKQRVKLGQAFFSQVPVVLLDEPSSNLDVSGIELYQGLVDETCVDRLLIICSNDEQEIDFCNFRLDLLKFKAF